MSHTPKISCSFCPAAVLVLFLPFGEGHRASITGSRLSLLTKVQARARVCPCMQMRWHTCLHTLTSAASHAAPLRAGCGSPDPRLHTGAGVPPAQPALLRLTYKQPGICHRRGGGRRGCHTHTHTACRHANTYTPRHTAWSCCLQPA